MPGRINEQDIEALRERADLAAVVADYTALKRAGSRLKGLCPFHQEKTPSFTVDPGRGLYHCFGCGEGGTVYTFLQKVEALSFPEAVERLARIVGYELRYSELSPGQRKAQGRRTRLVEAVAEAAAFYAAALRSPDGAPAIAYLATRGVGDEQIEQFGLGWAPDAWDALSRALLGRGFEPAELIDAGLATNGRQGLVDRLRGRVIFPISEATGRDVVAFGGRLVPGTALRTAPRDGPAPKYMNSPESEVYRKSRTLYGLNWARAEVQRRQSALVVEGYMDVIGLHLAGVRNAVAPCGTALTAEHLALLERHTPRVVLALDADEPGYAAAERARALAAEVGIREVGVLPLPPGQDPADLAGEGPAAVERALAGVVTAVEFQLTQLLRTAQLDSPEAQAEAYRRTFPLLTGIGDRFLRYRYLRDVVAPAVRLNADLLEQELDRAMAAGSRSGTDAVGGSIRDPRAAASPGDLGDGARDPQRRLEGWVLQVALQRPDLLPPMWEDVRVEDFRAPAAQLLFTALRGAPAGDLEAVLAALPDDQARSGARALLMAELSVEPDEAHVASLLAGLRAASVGRRLEEVRDELSRVNAQVDGARQRELSRLYLELEGRRRDLVEGRIA